MARIRTRETYEGPVRTLDRAAAISKNMRHTVIRTKEHMRQSAEYEQEQNENSYAGDRTIGMADSGAMLASDTAIRSFKKARLIGEYTDSGKSEFVEKPVPNNPTVSGSDVFIIDPEKEYRKTAIFDRKGTKTVRDMYRNGKVIYQNSNESSAFMAANADKMHIKHQNQAVTLYDFSPKQAEKGQEILKKQYQTKRAKEILKGGKDRSLKKVLASLKRSLADTKTVTAALAIAGSIALIAIIVCTFFGSAFYILGDENNSDFIPGEFEGVGSEAIVEVAVRQVGNVGGGPYWSWYGFNDRVEWCACFVSWCANQCGYLEDGIIPKFAVVGHGMKWFKDRGQWQKRGYHPKPGDIIFFDWDGDGLGNHVGIVESSDDTYVYTIEGNSGDRCRRRTYFLHSSVLMGYGIPDYPDPEAEEFDEKDFENK